MAYTTKNFKSKKAVKEAIAAGEKVTCYAPGLGEVPTNGQCTVEGPHYPQPHKWYGVVTIVNGIVTAIK
jgi:hypothetical protein